MSLMQKYSTVFRLVPNHSTMNLSSSFKNSGRNDKHAFGARYNRPMHDLDYVKPILQHSPINKSTKQLSKSNSKKSPKKPENTSQFRIKNLTRSQSKTNPSSPIKPVKASNYFIKTVNPESIPVQSNEDMVIKNMEKTTTLFNRSSHSFSLKALNKYRPSTFGLSQCELGNTIVGKIARKSSHHVDFGKTVDRPQNINKIWYNKDQVYSPVDREKNKNIKHKIHYFKSGSGHEVFQPKNVFDKFYDAPVEVVKKRTDVVIRDLNKVKPRPGLQIKLGTNLQYEKNRSFENKKRPIFEISQTKKQLVFTRQVISPKKGVYR